MADTMAPLLLLFSPVMMGLGLLIAARRLRRQAEQAREHAAMVRRYRDAA